MCEPYSDENPCRSTCERCKWQHGNESFLLRQQGLQPLVEPEAHTFRPSVVCDGLTLSQITMKILKQARGHLTVADGDVHFVVDIERSRIVVSGTDDAPQIIHHQS